jgi:hypothetical protein
MKERLRGIEAEEESLLLPQERERETSRAGERDLEREKEIAREREKGRRTREDLEMRKDIVLLQERERVQELSERERERERTAAREWQHARERLTMVEAELREREQQFTFKGVREFALGGGWQAMAHEGGAVRSGSGASGRGVGGGGQASMKSYSYSDFVLYKPLSTDFRNIVLGGRGFGA